MNIAETSVVLLLLRTAYPAFYRKMGADDADATLKLWQFMFADEEYQVVQYALKRLIENHTGYPPDIAAVKAQIREITAAAVGEPTDEELWQILAKAVTNGYYGAKEEFAKLPPVVQKWLGSPSALRDLATLDADILNTVTKGQFLKQIPIIRQRMEYHDSLPAGMAEALSGLYKRIPDELEGGASDVQGQA